MFRKILFILFTIVCLLFLFVKSNEWKSLFKDESKYQTIELIGKGDEFALLLNNNIQVFSGEYDISHKIQCHYPIKKYNPKKILILGGGDLLAARYCLEFPQIEKVTICEIDEKIVKFAKTNEIFKKITNDISKNEKLNIEIGDAIEYVKNIKKDEFDLIIEDVEIDFTLQNQEINRGSFLKMCLEKAKVFSGTVPDHSFKNLSLERDFKEINDKKSQFKGIGFTETEFKEIESIIDKKIIEACRRNYGDIYGSEAYIVIS